MNGSCDTCGEPAKATCAATGCEAEMCAVHITRKFSPILDIKNPPLIAAYCPQHAHLANN